ncbi:hypothetical protein GCM10023172_34680 [Hymenobacter ginsengisoli]|uniref:Uncharacterized protein n=1 Tax=Hymenobacter ginsengisoli TaxID=1051626 RepID=A0ABP8QRS2_9BACT|nr:MULTISPECIES: hypothetical protein [unclassified Hymenobacter]MBO2033049.1 hypothetical protein [Hymenobacter sp. BT559]
MKYITYIRIAYGVIRKDNVTLDKVVFLTSIPELLVVSISATALLEQVSTTIDYTCFLIGELSIAFLIYYANLKFVKKNWALVTKPTTFKLNWLLYAIVLMLSYAYTMVIVLHT